MKLWHDVENIGKRGMGEREKERENVSIQWKG